MTSSDSQEELRRIARRRAAPPAARRGRALVVLVGLGVVAVAGVGAWWAVGRFGLPVDGGRAAIQTRVLAWYVARQSDRLTPPSDDASPVTFEIAPNEALPSVAQRLAAVGLVRDAGAFRLLARVRGLDKSVQAGRFTLRADMSAEEVLAALQRGAADQVMVTIPEGLRAEEVAALLERQGVADRGTVMARVTSGRAPGRAALADRPDGATLEGYLFPDTYAFAADTTADAAVDRILETFEARVTPGIRTAARSTGRTLFEVVTLASIVERETVVAEERGMVARVYLNRLAEAPYILNADPTVQYALGFQSEAGTWWKRPLLTDDLRVDSPYNSYVHAGLPPGPIASPGLASIEAVVTAPEGDWQYFVANDVACDGTHVFASTYDAHLANVRTYQTGTCGR